MKKTLIVASFIMLILWPQPKSEAKESVTQSILKYQLTKHEVLSYVNDRKIEKIFRRIDSIKTKLNK